MAAPWSNLEVRAPSVHKREPAAMRAWRRYRLGALAGGAALAATADLHPREVVHALGAAVLQATGGNLRDDATMVCLDWHGGPPRGRNTEQGADPGRASPSA